MPHFDLFTWIALLLALVGTGMAAGILAGLLGVGGGIVIVPVLSWILALLAFPDDLSQHLAVATSLATIIPTAVSSSRSHFKKGAVDLPLLRLWGPGVVVGALIGGILSGFVSDNGLRLVFGFVALAVAINLALPWQLRLGPSIPPSAWFNRAIAATIGAFSALMGIGGGTLAVPTLAAYSFPIHRAVGTASAMGLLIAIPGVLGFIWSGWSVDGRPSLSLGWVSLPAAAIIFPMTYLFAPIGARLAHRLNATWLRAAFALFLAITAARMLWTALA